MPRASASTPSPPVMAGLDPAIRRAGMAGSSSAMTLEVAAESADPEALGDGYAFYPTPARRSPSA